MGTPRKHKILQRAKEIAQERAYLQGLPTITPTEQELKETGIYQEAQHELMGRKTEFTMQQEKYVHDVASEVGLKVVDPFEWKEKQQKIRKLHWKAKGFKHLAKTTHTIPTIPIVNLTKPHRRKTMKKMPTVLQLEKQITHPKPKRKKFHTRRVGKTMRKIKHVNGVKMFSFPDHIWKVRQPRRKKRR